MKLKEEKQDNFFYYLKKSILFLRKKLFNNWTKKAHKLFFILIILFVGFFSGLIASGYFGTFDQPSGRAYTFLSAIGINNLHELKIFTQGILKQNIKIPYNYFIGKFSSPDKLIIDIKFEDYQKIAYKRQQAIELGTLVSSGEDYVPATITHNGESHKVKLRLKGDLPDHWTGDKWSLRINVKGDDKILGMEIFSLQNPSTRQDLNEMIYQRALQLEGLIGLRYKFVEVVINGDNKGIYALEEHFSKELIENNQRRDGVILKFDEDIAFENFAREDNIPFELTESFYSSPVITFESEENILNDAIKFAQFEKGKNLLESLRRGDIQPHEIFDTEKIAKFYAVSTLMNCPHNKVWHNTRIYYNPVTSLLEPIGFDGNCRMDGSGEALKEYIPGCIYSEKSISNCPFEFEGFSNLILRDKIIFEKYIKELERMSQKEYLDNLFISLNEEIGKSIDIIHKNNVFYYFSSDAAYRGQSQIRGLLHPLKGINAYFIEKEEDDIILSIANVNPLPVEIESISHGEFNFKLNQEQNLLQPWNLSSVPQYQIFKFEKPLNFNKSWIFNLKVNYKIFGVETSNNIEILPWSYFEENFTKKDFIRQESNLSSFEFLEVYEGTKVIEFRKGTWMLKKDLIIPKGFTVFAKEGTEIDLIDESMILSYSPLNFRGSSKNPIKISSSDKTGQGLAVFNTEKNSSFENVEFSNLTNPSKEGWELSGALTFNEAPFTMNKVSILNIMSEDSVDIISSEYKIEKTIFKNCFSDCLDDDFGGGIIIETIFENCGNDCIDISGIKTEITNVEIINAGDKGISIGERGAASIKGLKINGIAYIGIASKDFSEVFLEDIEIYNATYGLAVYQKKAEFGPSTIRAENINFYSCENEYIVEDDSELFLNGVIILDKTKNTFKKLYEETII